MASALHSPRLAFCVERAENTTMAHDHPDHDSHGHGHSHSHHHAHDSHASHDHAHSESLTRPDLARGVGVGKTLYLDAPSGLAGDMIIAALLDLGAPLSVLEHAVSALGLQGFHLHVGTRVHSGIVATSFDVHVESAQPERTYSSIRELLDRAELSESVRALAHQTFLRLAEAEAKVHRSSLDDVHFHEVGAVDAIVDIVGSAALLEHIGASLILSPLPMGRGFVRARHGILPLPAPATVECLRGLSTYDGGLEFEFVTPTGAAICGAHAHASSAWPKLQPTHIGWGAGTATLPDRPNVLRAVLGELESVERSDDTHVVLEANLDDATGELVGHCIDALLRDGALDAWATPITMKKGRPAFSLSAIATLASADRVASSILRESTSLGVRRHGVSRLERPREVGSVSTAFGEVPIKISRGPFGPPQVKPEFDAVREIALAKGVPLREVLAAALAAARVKYPV